MAIDVNVKVNNELSEDTTIFYRLTSSSQYTVTLTPYSTSFDLTTPNQIWYVLNHDGITHTSFVSALSFSCITPVICSITVTLSTQSTTVSKEISASFVPYFLSAGAFEAFPTLYFDSVGNQNTLNLSNYRSNSVGNYFYGEGHTEIVNLVALSSLPVGASFIWNVSGLTVTQVTSSYSTVAVPSDSSGVQVSVPISLRATNSYFLYSGSIIYRDDVTGTLTYYPHYVSTVNPYGYENVSDTSTFGSIQILPYDATVPINFDDGVAGSTVFLDDTALSDGSYVTNQFDANLTISLSGESVDVCYGLYNTVWRWINVDVNNISNTFTDKPSSWADVACNSTYPKTWAYQSSNTSANLSPIIKNVISTTWTVNNDSLWETSPLTILNPANTQIFPYFLKYDGDGSNLNTCSLYSPSNITVMASSVITCKINALSGNDWIPRSIPLISQGTFIVDPYIHIVLYTPNRYVLTGSNVFFEVVGIDPSSTLIYVDDGENGNVQLTGSNVFNTVYNTLGTKTFSISSVENGTMKYHIYDNVIDVVTEYDVTNIDPAELRSENSPLIVPYPNTPYIAPNEWVVEDTINSVIEKMDDNLDYLNIRAEILNGKYTEFFGWYGNAVNVDLCPYKTWNDLINGNIIWENLYCSDETFIAGSLSACAPYSVMTCSVSSTSQNCLGLYCIPWRWNALLSTGDNNVTWSQTKNGGTFAKKWTSDGNCQNNSGGSVVVVDCKINGEWNLNIQEFGTTDNTIYETVPCQYTVTSCSIVNVVSRNNFVYKALTTQIEILSSDYFATEIGASKISSYDGNSSFNNIIGMAMDSQGKIFILDNLAGKVVGMKYEYDVWNTYSVWGGIGGVNSKNKFYLPNDINVDVNDNVLVADTGNNCVKLFTNNGVWINTITDSELMINAPISVAGDVDGNVHILTGENVRVYTSTGILLFTYDFSAYTSNLPSKINSSYGRICIYVVAGNQVLKFFKNGAFAGYILDGSNQCINEITSIFQDEYRNILISNNQTIVKIVDLLTVNKLNSNLPASYWNLNDMLIHKEEYVQNWVYNKSFQKVWDNIELFRSTLFFDTSKCKGYTTYVHPKTKIFIGINEIVTNTVINRIIGYLWDNFNTMLPYFDPNCK